MNGVTAFVDGSAIYGSSEGLSRRLRTLSGGQMKVVDDGGRLPREGAGDFRFSSTPNLMAVHTLFLRYVNIVAR